MTIELIPKGESCQSAEPLDRTTLRHQGRPFVRRFTTFAVSDTEVSEMSSTRGEFDALIDAIGRARGLRTATQVADLAGISTGHLSQLKRGKRHMSRDVYDKLSAAFPEFEERLAAVLDAHESRALDPTYEELRRIEVLIERGRAPEARGALARLVARPNLPPSIAAPAFAHLGSMEFDAGATEEGVESFLKAIECARRTSDSSHADMYLERLAIRLTQSELYDVAERIVAVALASDFYNTTLWRRLGVVRWYGDSLLDAYGALSVALLLGHARNHVLHARGQVLAELGQYDAAIAELTEAIDNARSPLSEAYARSSRAWAYAQAGDLSKALAEFEASEQETPENAWLHFFRARCYDMSGETELALAGFGTSLRMSAPPLTRAKREFAQARVAALKTTS